MLETHTSSFCDISQSVVTDADRFGESFDAQTASKLNIASVRCLNDRSGPSAISGLVPLSVVNAVKRMSVRTIAHILKKRGERVNPAVADCNPSPAVSAIRWILCVVAARLHRRPRAVFPGVERVAPVFFSTVPRCGCRTAATLSVTIAKIAANNDGRVAAIALTQPSPISWSFPFRLHHHNELAESFPS